MYQILGGIPVKTRISGFFLDLFRDHRRRQQHSTLILAESWMVIIPVLDTYLKVTAAKHIYQALSPF
jgi:hypothetical protein